MTTQRDIPFDEEVPERSVEHRDAFAHIAPLANLEAGRQRFAEEFDAKVSEPAFSQITIWKDVRNNYTGVVETTTGDDFGRALQKMQLMVAKFTHGDEAALADLERVWPDLGSRYGVATRIGRGENTVTVSLQYLMG